MPSPARSLLPGLLLASTLAACATQAPIPEPRSVIVYSGERIQAEGERMQEVETWLRPQLEEIDRNPDFLVRIVPEDEPRYPWDALEINADTAIVSLHRLAQDAETPFMIYAHYHLLRERENLDDLEEWLPGADESASELEVERLILERVADVWLLGRSVFDTQPFGPLDELMYAHEFGYLAEFIFATQGERFARERDRFLEEEAEREEAFRGWFLRTFEREGPGYLPEAAEGR